MDDILYLLKAAENRLDLAIALYLVIKFTDPILILIKTATVCIGNTYYPKGEK